jgi:hypothetical protein
LGKLVEVLSDDEYTDIDDPSDEEDSDSQPSEDNFSDTGLEEWHEKIRQCRKDYIQKLKSSTMAPKDITFPQIKSLLDYSLPQNNQYLTNNPSRFFREAKKIDVYEFSLTPQNMKFVNAKILNGTTPMSKFKNTSPKTSKTYNFKPSKRSFRNRKQSYVGKANYDFRIRQQFTDGKSGE